MGQGGGARATRGRLRPVELQAVQGGGGKDPQIHHDLVQRAHEALRHRRDARASPL